MSDDDDVTRWKRAGAAALRFNSPLSEDRAAGLAAAVTAEAPDLVVDLGCGRGELLLECLAAAGSGRGVGVDSDPGVIAEARALAGRRGLAERVEFVCGDAGEWRGGAGAALCVASSHTLGGLGSMLERLGEIVERGRIAVGDGFWQSPPDEWCLQVFGEMPASSRALAGEAVARGWSVVGLAESSPQEWDAFEGGWCDGVRGLGEPAANEFADRRWAQYVERYRGRLGFAWLVAERAPTA